MPIIEKTDVIEDDKEDEVVRVAHFIEAHGQPAHSVREVCRSYYPTKVGAILLSLPVPGQQLMLHLLKGRFHSAKWRRHHQYC